ncbi:MAG: D-cysteine desulfhydrase family protein [Sneathiellales bacterium]|nr:D-cysteine desulfhydrase family protein [Sneathiellales bacterium]
MSGGKGTVSGLEARLARFSKIGLLTAPTPFERMWRLEKHLGGPKLWVKREDCIPTGSGGNKLRKLDYVLAEAVSKKADVIVSGGVVQSNSQRQVAAAAARMGLDCHLAVFHGRVARADSSYEENGNAFLNRLFGAQLHPVAWNGDRNAALYDLADNLRKEGRKPYVVPYGVSSGLGAVGYASAVTEIARQAHDHGFSPDAIVHCSGSGATQAGLIVGTAIALRHTDVIGIDIDAEPERVEADVLRYAKEASAMLELDMEKNRVNVVAGHSGPAYGVPHEQTIEAISLAGRLEALVLDPVYSGKGLAGLISLISQGNWSADQNVVFVHTGGAPALYAYQDVRERLSRTGSEVGT